jgi:hypothetical protein
MTKVGAVHYDRERRERERNFTEAGSVTERDEAWRKRDGAVERKHGEFQKWDETAASPRAAALLKGAPEVADLGGALQFVTARPRFE